MSIVKTDNFTTGTNQALTVYDSNWVSIIKTGTAYVRILASNDYLNMSAANDDEYLEYEGPGSPTDDQKITMDLSAGNSEWTQASLTGRCTGGEPGYTATLEGPAGNYGEFDLWRGEFYYGTLLDDASPGVSADTWYTSYLTVVGSGTNDVEFKVGAYTALSATSDSGNATGYVGIGGYYEGSTGPRWDNLIIEDLSAGGGAIATVNGVAFASVKTINGIAIASVATWNGVSTT